MKNLPNILTGSRLVMALFMFVAMAAAAGVVPGLSIDVQSQLRLERWAFYAFVIASVTDFFDGWLARKLDAVSVWGAILDPIGDKILVCGALLGLLALGSNSGVVLPAGLILFREFTVSALREVGAGKGVKLPVTLLAKWKTTLQLVAIGAEMILASWGAFGLPPDPGVVGGFTVLAQFLLWAATGVTLITGAQYWEAARKALT
ncbi:MULTISPECIES: CDP-diacylglycerol--glycerol-3-phosphate 3-phosphatidyltransferase [Caulobacter]|jgi:CDP-diacylglycerol--glycerol-3-phosphate 3-phosphatidyltransferase|uniref:CDP-diacylglycerol--glycerol-3-phosphate 3-phosphatidyltransferase n=1 Tax=Caulobacter vibrioides OR37 TaxID=1292034 RepID=R0EHP1_CAUVI|nr:MULTISPECIES: CDP-diacylglycerol--glycerol-3-phosphate 3-phosphatidyltransferase [Caulobacter]ENZ80707.1 CDP-diacylglycerol--glycerol-3-phosphate 3-phosphatidyltransferase [Caulobacter vibrioides OR37]MBQ1560830.1 CDP-diacylglycerol--glycerol-3-phosphate 3-phosphatidyltransferase [Caulobacter sp.]